MARIIWLDDEPGYVEEAIAQLRFAGHKVDIATSDDQFLQVLDEGRVPDIVIQDLFRPGFDSEESLAFSWETLRGWDLYERVLKARYPQVGVVICSMVAEEIEHRRKADDFNLILLHKTGLKDKICKAIDGMLQSQSPVFNAVAVPPAVLAVDFDKVSGSLINYLAHHPLDIHQVSWATFEKLVERLLTELGYDVFRTPLTRDGGVDLWAVSRSDLGEIQYAIDAKKYSPARLVGPEPVRAIHGVADLARSSIGMIVTTSYFSPGAISLAEQYRYKISLQDFDRVSEWIRKASRGEAFRPTVSSSL